MEIIPEYVLGISAELLSKLEFSGIVFSLNIFSGIVFSLNVFFENVFSLNILFHSIIITKIPKSNNLKQIKINT